MEDKHIQPELVTVDGEPILYAGEPVVLKGFLTEAQLRVFFDTLPQECCAACRFWKTEEPPEWSDLSRLLGKPTPYFYGQCQRRSPVVQVPRSDDTENLAVWPEVGYANWCGDFQPDTSEGK